MQGNVRFLKSPQGILYILVLELHFSHMPILLLSKSSSESLKPHAGRISVSLLCHFEGFLPFTKKKQILKIMYKLYNSELLSQDIFLYHVAFIMINVYTECSVTEVHVFRNTTF